jgi:hypothetical protein
VQQLLASQFGRTLSAALLQTSRCIQLHTGIAGAVLLPVTGVAVGTAQLVRGAVNTPEALKQASQGKHWDEVRG